MLLSITKNAIRSSQQYLLEILLSVSVALLICQIGYPFYVAWINQPHPGGIVRQEFLWSQENQGEQKNLPIGYWLYLPEGYTLKEEWPLVIYLHGTGGRGYDLDRIRRIGPLHTVREGKDLPAILAVPQCPKDLRWDKTLVADLLEEVLNTQNVDKRKVFLTGYSMGGFGTWRIGSELPNHFAALVPLAGGGDEKNASILSKKPIWAFHGEKDKIVSLERSKQMVEAVELAGGSPKLTIFSEAGHSINSLVYEDPTFWEWLFEQELSSSSED